MILPSRPLFDRFGSLQTWIVGIQYYQGRTRIGAPAEVFFDREPDNPFDPFAIAVFTRDGTQIGHLPRYDARHLAPLIDEGAIALAGQVTGCEKGGRLPLRIDVHATEKLSPILARDFADDWRAIFHNMLVDLWPRFDAYSSESLEAFRERMRDLAHSEDLFPKTEFLYRMMKAVIESRALKEQEACKKTVFEAVRAMNVGAPLGWPELMVFPIDVPEPSSAPVTHQPEKSDVAVVQSGDRHDFIRTVSTRCPYPAGAKGILVFTRHHFHSLRWFSDPSCAQIAWFMTIFEAKKMALRGPFAEPPADVGSIKNVLLDSLDRAKYKRMDGGTPVRFTVRFEGEDHEGVAEIEDHRPVFIEYCLDERVYAHKLAAKKDRAISINL